MLSPCYDTIDTALEDAGAVVRGWTAEAPVDLRLLLSIREEEPFHVVLAAYGSPDIPGGPRASWLSALVLRKEHCGWMWAGAATRRRTQPGSALEFGTTVDRDARFWVALGETSPDVGAVDCVYADGSRTTTRPAEGAVVIGGRLRGPRALEVRGRDGAVLERHELPRSLAIELPPRDGPPHGELDIEASGRTKVLLDEDEEDQQE